jgi:tRNA modification GTPase
LIDASTESAARSGQPLAVGRVLAARFTNSPTRLIHLRMLIEATLDFPEEEIDFLQQSGRALVSYRTCSKHWSGVAGARAPGRAAARGHQGGDRRPAQRRQELACSTRWRGPSWPSSPRLPAPRAIVVQQTIQIEGVPLHVIDTAGLRQGADVRRGRTASASNARGATSSSADALLFLHDLTRLDTPEYIAEEDRITLGLGEKLPKNIPVIDVWNKLDAARPRRAPCGRDVVGQDRRGARCAAA